MPPFSLHWVWGNRWLALLPLGVLDLCWLVLLLHFSSATAALALILVLGSRRGFLKKQFLPHNLMFTLIGTGILWFGWFGF